jgi:hypothetical protein
MKNEDESRQTSYNLNIMDCISQIRLQHCISVKKSDITKTSSQ